MVTPPAKGTERHAAASPAVQLLIGVVLLLLVWSLRSVVLLTFGAIIAAAFLRGVGDPIARRVGMSPRLAILLVILLMVGLLALAMWAMGQPLLQQLQDLQTTVPRAWASLQAWAANQPVAKRLLEWSGAASGFTIPWARVASAASAATGAAADLVLILLLGIYLALDPALYRDGFLRLVPPSRRVEIGTALMRSGEALQRWLLGQGLTMAIVGTTVGIGLALLGMPLAAAVGLISGLLEFVPFFGAIASALLGTLLAFAQGPAEALYVGIFFFAIQQVEGNVVIPLVQRWAVHLPPVLSLLAVVIFGTLFGVEGIVLGTPLMVVLLVLVKTLYVEGRLEGK